jgi:hypothetical protein
MWESLDPHEQECLDAAMRAFRAGDLNGLLDSLTRIGLWSRPEAERALASVLEQTLAVRAPEKLVTLWAQGIA